LSIHEEEEKVEAAFEKDQEIIQAEQARLLAVREKWIKIKVEILGSDPIDILAQPQLVGVLMSFQRQIREIHPALVTGKIEGLVLDEDQMEKFTDISLAFIHKCTHLPLDWLKKEMRDIRVINSLVTGIFKISTESANPENLEKFR